MTTEPTTQGTQHQVIVTYTVTYSVLIEGSEDDAERFGKIAPRPLPEDDFDSLLLLATKEAGVMMSDATDPIALDVEYEVYLES